MDAKVGDWVVTPRIGKPVEVNALWFNALCLMAVWARELQREATDYQQLATQVGRSFRTKFWNDDRGCLYDVIDGPEGNDPSLRPNQLFAVSLPFASVFGPQAQAVVDTVQSKLMTPVGPRSLATDDPKYAGGCHGTPWLRDGAYHQGTVWPWLIGAFVDAHLRVYNNRDQAKTFLLPLIRHMDAEGGAGTISEIFDGDAPYQPRGCIAQAWSVAEVLRCWHDLHAPEPQRPLTHTEEHNHNGRH
jgi:glycogen debranching enzyme